MHKLFKNDIQKLFCGKKLYKQFFSLFSETPLSAPKAISSSKSVVDIETNIAVITYYEGFRELVDVMSTFQLKSNSELYNFSMGVDQR